MLFTVTLSRYRVRKSIKAIARNDSDGMKSNHLFEKWRWNWENWLRHNGWNADLNWKLWIINSQFRICVRLKVVDATLSEGFLVSACTWNLYKWGLASSDKCKCVLVQTTSHILQECLVSKLLIVACKDCTLLTVLQITGWREQQWNQSQNK